MSKHNSILTVALFTSFFLAADVQGQTTWYVDDDASLGGDGLTWPTAFKYLQDALTAATDSDEIRVAGGSYTPDQDEGGNVTPGERTETFQLITGVEVYGGYRGCPGGDCTGGDPDERDVTSYQTILSGDLAGDDAEVASPEDLLYEPTRAKNSYHVVTGSGTDETAILDGFTISAGNANGTAAGSHERAGGMSNFFGHPTVCHCTFTENSAAYAGGAMHNNHSFLTMIGCAFNRNSAGLYGGGAYNLSGSPTAANCTYVENSAWAGGGMSNKRSDPTVTDCRFSENSATYRGGGMYNSLDSSPTVANCTFSGNCATDYGGGMHNYQHSNPTIANCVFSDNSAGSRGGGMMSDDSSPTMTDCTFNANSAGAGGGMYHYASHATVTDCTFTANSAYDGGGMYNRESDPGVTTCTFVGNSADSDGGGMQNLDSSPTVTDCTFSGNSGEYGGAMRNDNGSPTVTNCAFSGNSAYYYGGAMRNFGGTPAVRGCTFTGNWTHHAEGGGMYNIESTPTVTHCTFTGNSARAGGGVYNTGGDPTVASCTFSGNLSDWSGGGMCNAETSVIVAGCTFEENAAEGSCGGLLNRDSNAVVGSCTFSGNSSGLTGGAMCHWGSIATVTDCAFAGNSAAYGGGMYNQSGSTATIINCTFTGNSASDDGGGIADFGILVAVSCILWGNTDSSGTGESAQLHVSGSSPQIDYSCIQGLTGELGGVDNISNDPLLIDADGPDDIPGTADDNLLLSPGSPCIDAGDNTAVPLDVTDLDGDGDTDERTPFDVATGSRFVDDPCTADMGVADLPDYPDIVDMGAYEYRPGDADGDGDYDLADFASLQSCFTDNGGGPVTVACAVFDYDCLDDVDRDDYALFVLRFTGP